MPTPIPPLPERPAIRPLEVRQIADGRHRGIVLVDRLGLSEPAFVPEELLPIVGRCTGEATLAQIRRAASEQVGAAVPAEFVAGVVQQLADRLLLLGERFDAAVADAAAAFLGGGARPARHAGSAGYPAEPAALRAALGELVRGPRALAAPAAPLRGLVAPHLDLRRGAAGYRAAYERLLAAPPADLYVVFGTGHGGPLAPVTGLSLDWQTPLGIVTTDRGFVGAVHETIGAAQPLDVLLHRDEHSIEFEVLLLQFVHERRGADRPFQVAGFLCGALPSAAGNPLDEDWVQRLLAAFRAAECQAGRSVCYVAGADLAHVGPVFGDPQAVGERQLEALAAAERERLRWLERGEPGGFHAAVACGGNSDRVCSAPAITLAAALAGGPGELLHYGQARTDDGSQAVTFCAMGFPGT